MADVRKMIASVGMIMIVLTADVSDITIPMVIGLVCTLQILVPTWDRDANFGKGKWVMHPMFRLTEED